MNLGALATGFTAASFGLIILVAALGPSAAEVPLPGKGFPFPLAASADPHPWTVTGLLSVAVLVSMAAVALGVAAIRRGWSPSPRRMLLWGTTAVIVVAMLPPIASTDVLNYAAYGRIASLGGDPYRVPSPRMSRDPVVRRVEAWRDVPSVYGPLASREQEAILRLTRGHLRAAVWLLCLVNAAAFAAAGWLVFRMAGPEPHRRRRAALLFVLNPVLVFAVVSGGHLDALVAVTLAAAMGLLARRPLLAGVVAGAAGLVKVTAGLPVAGWLLQERRSLRRFGLLAAGFAATVAAGFASVGTHALDQLLEASRWISWATPWAGARTALEAVLPSDWASTVVRLSATGLSLALAATLARKLPSVDDDDVARVAARGALVFALAWTLAAPYALGWYDVVPWTLMALLPASRYDGILLAHTGALALAWLPGRTVDVPAGLTAVFWPLRARVTPVILAVLVVLAFAGDRASARSTLAGAEAGRGTGRDMPTGAHGTRRRPRGR